MKNKLSTLIATTLAAGILFAGCSPATPGSTGTPPAGGTTSTQSTAAPAEKKSIYFVSLKVGGAAWSQAQKGFEDACKDFGWDGFYVAPTTANDASQMANLCETAITAQADAIIGPLYDPNMFGDIITRAQEDGMLVGTTNTYLGGVEDFNIGTDQKNMGAIQAQTLIDLVGTNKCKVVWMTMNLTTQTALDTYEEFCKTLEGHDNITVHGIEYDDNNPTVAADKMNSLWKADPEINAVVCNDSSGASMGVPNFIEENNLSDKFYTVGIDASADILNYVMSGALDATLDQNFYRMGYDSVLMCKDIWDGKTVPMQTDSGMNLVTAENAVEYGASRGYEVTGKKK